MTAKPEIRFRMAPRSPAEWAEFIDRLYETHRVNESVQEIVRLTIMAAVEAGYRAGVTAAAAYIRCHAEGWERPRHIRAGHIIADDDVQRAISDVAKVVEKMRPPAPEPVPDEQGKNDDQG